MRRATLDLKTGESITFAVETGGLCGICIKEPKAERLEFDMRVGLRRTVHATLCRHCLSEHSPELLAVLEARA